MNMSLLMVLPEEILALGAIALMLVSAWGGQASTRMVSVAAVAVLAGAMIALTGPASYGGAAFGGLFRADAFGPAPARARQPHSGARSPVCLIGILASVQSGSSCFCGPAPSPTTERLSCVGLTLRRFGLTLAGPGRRPFLRFIYRQRSRTFMRRREITGRRM